MRASGPRTPRTPHATNQRWLGCRRDEFRRIEGHPRVAHPQDMSQSLAVRLDRVVVMLRRRCVSFPEPGPTFGGAIDLTEQEPINSGHQPRRNVLGPRQRNRTRQGRRVARLIPSRRSGSAYEEYQAPPQSGTDSEPPHETSSPGMLNSEDLCPSPGPRRVSSTAKSLRSSPSRLGPHARRAEKSSHDLPTRPPPGSAHPAPWQANHVII